jgi:hypothetical protein
MAVLVTAIHVFERACAKPWMAGSRPSAGPAMTMEKSPSAAQNANARREAGHDDAA